ncbi:hypothetical protein CRM22_009605 [Opisthorchis felineus]|uniref:Troponin T n=1 Tax=Opisthorchis felineus TaxID=147828 RepID=A0A4S2LDV7_OPIFE|nr:hypothetical protein CRM22_009605 [Opisthorchis felineus]TGZ58509.1 hypothetical protein CRM22_009605 [Opisthorchis felineus]TGZ58510.1 hypothetical protein CRM22_009605 [Opisthorchis felineus]TGZ58512.1 hypothetical protein CRM22_009605 [Opisthorchis felineus]
MSDDEHSPLPTPVPAFNEDGKSEAQIRMEQEAKRRRERAEEEWREYEEFRRGEREKAEEEIRQLKERRERRKAERAEEEKRLAEARLVEEQKRRAEEEERQRKKREEEQRKREERERKRQEWEEKKNANRPNFVITKREGGPEVQAAPQEEKKEEVTKSKEQLEAERRSIIDQRVPPLNVSGMSVEQLKAKAKELHDLLFRIEGENYDLGQRFKRQSYDMQELAERARQMNKGGKARAIPNELDARAAKFSGIPPMVVMYSQYERVKDPRSFSDRRTVFSGENYAEEFHRIAPTHQIVMTDEGFRVLQPGEAPPHHEGAPPAEAVEAQ